MIDPLALIKLHQGAAPGLPETIQTYYDGQQAPAALQGVRIDGRNKSQIITGWVPYVANFHAGFLTARDVNYSLNNESPEGKAAIDNWIALADEADLNAADTTHALNALLAGFSVEILSYDGEQIRFQPTSPLEWRFARDASGKVVAATRKVVLEPGTVWADELLTDQRTLFYVYLSDRTDCYEMGANGPVLIESVANLFGDLPLVVFSLTKDRTPFFSWQFLRQCDSFDIVRSALVDDISYNVDSLLLLNGVPLMTLFSQQVLATDSEGNEITKSLADVMRESKVLCLPDKDSGASFVGRTVDIEKFRYSLSESRRAIHEMGAIPDLQELGALNQISGVALRLRFQHTIQIASGFVKHFEPALRRRVSLVNKYWRLLGRPALNDYDISVQLNIPEDSVSLMQYITNLKDLVPDRELLRMLPGVERPEQAHQELLDQRQAAADAAAAAAAAEAAATA